MSGADESLIVTGSAVEDRIEADDELNPRGRFGVGELANADGPFPFVQILIRPRP